MNVDRNIRHQRQRVFQAALADEAPGANHVGDDVDAKRRWRAGRDRHDKPPCGCSYELNASSGRPGTAFSLMPSVMWECALARRNTAHDAGDQGVDIIR